MKGGQRAKAPKVHTLTSPRVYRGLRDVLGQKAYFRCLLGLPHLLQGELAELPSAAAPKYYELVLSGQNPRDVFPDVSVECDEVVQALGEDGPSALSRSTGAAPLGEESDDGGDRFCGGGRHLI